MDKIEFPAEYKTKKLSGALTSFPSADFENEVLLLELELLLADDQDIRLVFNSSQKCSVWIDGKQCINHEGGKIIPSPHRTPDGHFADLSLVSGKHTVIASVNRPLDDSPAVWCIIAADAKSKQWLPNGFIKS